MSLLPKELFLPLDPDARFARFKDDFEEALKQWKDLDIVRHLRRWHLVRRALKQIEGDSVSHLRQVVDALLLQGLRVVEAADPRNATIVRERFMNNVKVDTVAARLNLNVSRIYPLQNQAFAHLFTPLYEQELQALAQHQAIWQPRLETSTYTQLIGVESQMEALYQLLDAPQSPWLVAFEGIGGIGKTSFANRLIHHLVDYSHFEAFAWVTARQTSFTPAGQIFRISQPALRVDQLVDALLEKLGEGTLGFTTPAQKQAFLYKRFKEQPHFVVIDNLETVEDVNTLLPLLQSWCNPSKFLLTSRERIELGSGLYHVAIRQLSETDAIRLVRHEAEGLNFSLLATASEEQIKPIFATVGGNPLALRLVVGQAFAHGLDTVLDDLRSARGAKVEALYTYIYRRAWDKLDDAARLTWMTLPLVDVKSATIEQVSAATIDLPTALDIHQVRFALDMLVRMNLVDCHGELNARRYAVHSLTRTFLYEQVARWGKM